MKRSHLTLCLLVPLAVIVFGSDEGIRFVDVTARAGLRAPLEGMMGHAAAWGDLDGDGDLDLYVGGFADRPDAEYRPAQGPVANRLFRNAGNGRFEPIVDHAVEIWARSSSAVFVDLNNDGMLDLFVANNMRPSSRLAPGLQRTAQLRGSVLFQNDHGHFIDVTGPIGNCLAAPGSARSIGVLDYDADGLLDLLILEDRFGPAPRSRLCRNLGGFVFANVTASAGLPADLYGLGLAIADLNEDGRPDIFVSHSNRLFTSTKGGGYVEPEGLKATLAWTPLDAEDWPAGAVFADLNRDARPDLILGVHHDRARNRVYLNEGLKDGFPVLRDVSVEAGLPAHLSTKSPHVEVQDFDNDGWPDLYFSAAGIAADGEVTPLVFRSLGARNGLPRFELPRQLATNTPLVYFPAGPSGDYDGDGRLDLFLANWFRANHSRLLRNVSGSNHWLAVGITGKKMNGMGIGAKVHVYEAGAINQPAALLGFREIGVGYGFASGQARLAHFGLGARSVVDVRVTFPSGRVTTILSVSSNRQLTVEER